MYEGRDTRDTYRQVSTLITGAIYMAPHCYEKLWPFYASRRKSKRKRDVSSLSPAKKPTFLCPSDANKLSFPEAFWVTDKRNQMESRWNQLHYFFSLPPSPNAGITHTPETPNLFLLHSLHKCIPSCSAPLHVHASLPSAFPVLFSSSHLPPPHLSILFFTAKWTITRSVVSGVRSLM